MVEIIIAGSRSFFTYDIVRQEVGAYLLTVDDYKNTVEIISGGAKGADQLGEEFARRNLLKLKVFPANWNKWGRQAGYIRNDEMAEYAFKDGNKAVLFAFWDGFSRGTQHMINKALAFYPEFDVHVVRYNYGKNVHRTKLNETLERLKLVKDIRL